MATDYEDISWHEMVFLNFESGRSDRGKALTERCLRSTTAEADVVRPHLIEAPQGPWDAIMIYTLDDAPLEKKWETPAGLETLRRACTTTSGKQVADVNWEEYKDIVVRSSSIVGFSGRLGPGLAQLSATSNGQ